MHEIATITTTELWEKVRRGDSFYLVEILPHTFYRHTHLPGAINLPPRDVESLTPILLPDRTAEVIVYCIGFT